MDVQKFKTRSFVSLFLATVLGIAAGMLANRVIPMSTRAASAPQYKTEIVNEYLVSNTIAKDASDGWQVVTATVYWYQINGQGGATYLLIFRK